MIRIFGAAMAAFFAFAFSAATAQTYPAGAVKVVVPQAPGGATDVFARYVSQKLGERWGQAVVVENRAGAAGIVGTEVVAKSAPDGLTLLFTYEGSQAINQSLYSRVPFDGAKDFAAMATVATTPFFLVVGAPSPIKDFRDLIVRAKAKAGGITYATSGSGSINHLLSESLKAEAGIDMVHVPYKAIAAAMADVMAGTVDNAFAAVPSAIGLIRAGKLRAIAVSSAKRNPAMPEVPSIAELGFPKFDINPWWGLLAPAGTPKAIVDKVNADVGQVLRTSEAEAFFAKNGAQVFVSAPDAFQARLVADIARWAAVVKASGVKVD